MAHHHQHHAGTNPTSKYCRDTTEHRRGIIEETITINRDLVSEEVSVSFEDTKMSTFGHPDIRRLFLLQNFDTKFMKICKRRAYSCILCMENGV